MVERQHLGLGLVRDPLHVAVLKIVEYGDGVSAEDRPIAVQILAFECVDDHGLVLDTDQGIEPSSAQAKDRGLKLPRRCIGSGHGEMPGDVVLEDGRGTGFKHLPGPHQVKQAVVVSQNAFRSGEEHGHTP